MNEVQKRVALVLRRLTEMAERNWDEAESLADGLEIMLDELHEVDFFGTEGQSDPRGDFRNGHWSMARVEGIDS